MLPQQIQGPKTNTAMTNNGKVRRQLAHPQADCVEVIAQIADCIKSASSIAILSHQRPDGDAIGSSLGLGLAISKLGKQVQIACPDPVPHKYRFLPGAEQVVTELAQAPQVAVVVDTDGWQRLGKLQGIARSAETTVLIDHHSTNPGGADLDYLDSSAAAAAAQVYYLLTPLGVELDAPIATCLYCGLGADTGFFTFQNTSAPALEVAAELVAAGADPYQIAQQASVQLSAAAAILRGRALSSIQTAADSRIVYATLTPDDFVTAGAQSEDTEGVVDLLKSVGGAEVAVLFKADTHHRWQISLRARGVDVATVAAQFGGGGHSVAAGLEMAGSLPTVRAKVIKAIQQALNGES